MASRRRWGCAGLFAALALGVALLAWPARDRPAESAHAIPLDRLLVRGDPTRASACAACHDDQGEPLSGKRRREIVQEWLRTELAETRDCVACHPAAGEGERPHCQPPPTGLTATVRFLTEGPHIAGKLVAVNAGAAHRLPSYADTERVLTIEQIDRAGLPLPGTAHEAVVGRRIADDEEEFDTRLLPGESHTLPYITTLHPEARALRARISRTPGGTTVWEEIVRLAE